MKYKKCTWKRNKDGAYETGCNNIFEFINDGPEENGAKYCQYCGGKLITKK